MASRWIVNHRGAETLAFRELVALARSGDLTENDLVKAEWEPEWRPAHTVVGLFYRVRRVENEPVAEVAESSESTPLEAFEESAFSLDDLAVSLETADESELAPEADPRWMQRFREVTEQRTREASTRSPIEEAATTGTSQVHLLAVAAVQALEERSAASHRWARTAAVARRFQEFWRTPVVFRAVSALFVAGLVSYSVATWSRQAALRFPKPGMPDRYVVPLLGDCDSREFGVVLCSLAFWSAVLGYWGAKQAENLAESR